MAAINWARMYARARRPVIRVASQRPNVTAGLKWPPDTAPSAETITASASPWAKATNVRSPAEATAAMPMKKKRNVPKNSAKIAFQRHELTDPVPLASGRGPGATLVVRWYPAVDWHNAPDGMVQTALRIGRSPSREAHR